MRRHKKEIPFVFYRESRREIENEAKLIAYEMLNQLDQRSASKIAENRGQLKRNRFTL